MWHYELNGQSVGPVSEDAIRLLIRDGALRRSTLVWKGGMSVWKNAEQTDLFRCFQTPPQLVTKSDSVERAVEHFPPWEGYPFKTEQGTAHNDLSARHAEILDDASGLTQPTYHAISENIQPLAGIFGYVQIAIASFVLISVITIASKLYLFGIVDQALYGVFQSDDELVRQTTAAYAFELYASLAYFVVLLLSAAIIGLWTYRAMKNLRAMGYKTTVSPGWTIGWHLVPIACTLMPFRGVAQIWRGYIGGAPTGDDQLPVSMRFWWASWLLGNAISYAAVGMYDSGMSLDDLAAFKMALGLGSFGYGLHIVSAVLLLGLMKKVTLAQQDDRALLFR